MKHHNIWEIKVQRRYFFVFYLFKKLTNSEFNFRILNEKTPRSFTFLLAGCLPAEAMIHKKQLSLFMMIRNDPLNHHARYVYNSVKCPFKSWFSQILSLCTMYGLEHPLELLESPPKKKSLKEAVNTKVLHYWEIKLRDEASALSSLLYFSPIKGSLSSPHPLWLSAGSSSFECRKAVTHARMLSGRFMTEYLARHWSENKGGYCTFQSCTGLIGTLEHMLIWCHPLAHTRENSSFYF